MGVFDHFPYTNFHELNLMWILEALKEIQQTMEDFVSLNAIKYADPIQWDITRQYEKNTIVIDPMTGTAYISVRPVPSGAAITDEDYWTVVFNLGQFVVKMAQNLANVVEPETTLTATVPSSYNDWIIWGDVLYRNINPSGIVAGDAYVIGSNIEAFTIEDVMGHIEDLATTDKSNLVAAINEVLQTIIDTCGDLNDLTTTDKSNLVAAINDVLQIIIDTCGDLNDLTTADQSNLVAAINEINLRINNLTLINVRDYGAVGDGVTDDSQAFSDALAVSGALYVPIGEYLIDAGSVTFPSNKTIIGESSAESIIKNSGPTLLNLHSNDVVKNITFKANAVQAVVRLNSTTDVALIDVIVDADTCDYGLSIQSSTNVKISGLDTLNAGIDNISMDNVTASFITLIRTHNATRYGLTIGNSSDIVISNSVVKDNGSTGNVNINSSRLIVVGNLYINNGYHGVQFNTCNRCVYSSTISSGNTYSGFDMYSSYSCKMIGCVSENNGTMGLEVDSMSFNNSVTGNTFRRNGSCGITVYRSPRNVIISNDIIDNGIQGAIPGFDPTPSGIMIHDDNTGLSRENIVAYNVIGDDQATHTQHYGVQIEAGCVDITLMGNNFYTNLTAPVYIYDESQFAAVRYNVGYTPAKYTNRTPTVTPYDATITAISGGPLYNMFDGSAYGLTLTANMAFTLDNVDIAAYIPVNLATVSNLCALPVTGISGVTMALAVITDGNGTTVEPCIVALNSSGHLRVTVDTAHTATTQITLQMFNISLPGTGVV